MQPVREKSPHRYLPEIPRNSCDNSNRNSQAGMSEFESCLVSQPLPSLETFESMSRGRPPFAGFLPLAKSLCVPKFDISSARWLKISTHLRHCSRALSDLDRWTAASGAPVSRGSSQRRNLWWVFCGRFCPPDLRRRFVRRKWVPPVQNSDRPAKLAVGCERYRVYNTVCDCADWLPRRSCELATHRLDLRIGKRPDAADTQCFDHLVGVKLLKLRMSALGQKRK